MAYGADRGLALTDKLVGEPALAGYAQLPAVRGELLAMLGHRARARAEFDRAAALTSNGGERALFAARAADLANRRNT
jgi:RNA polymerase sigma-70 factor, ECF subfamily